MDNEAFDRLTRLLSGAGTRRATLGAVLATALLGRESGGAKNRRQRRRVRTQAQSPCQNPGPGKNLSGCDYSGADLRGRSFRGANLSRAKLIGAELCSADLRGANLHKTDFTGAHLTRTDLRGTNLSSAILTDAHFCQTRMPKGTLNNANCPPDGDDVCCRDEECDGVCKRGLCLERSCHSLGQLCQSFPFEVCGNCCGSLPNCDKRGVVCLPEADIITWRCRLDCSSDADCAEHGDNFECRRDIIQCPGSDKCCVAKACTRDENCTSGKCCLVSSRNGVCCRSDQRCGFPAFELPCVDL